MTTNNLFKRTGGDDFPTHLKVMVSGPPKSGKGLANGQRVLTPMGWVAIEALTVGTEISHPTLGRTTVTGVFPQGIRPLYRVLTDDGGQVVCDDSHLWTVRPHGLSERTVSTPELVEAIKTNARFAYLPMIQPDSRWQSALGAPDLDPYALGLLLGDGGLAGTTPRFHKPDLELHESLRQHLEPLGTTVGEWDDDSNSLSLTGGKLRQILDENNLRVLSYEKHIPQRFFDLADRDRFALLQGLLDTDGGMNGKSTCFYTSSPQLAQDVQRLVWSLGGSAAVRDKIPTYVYKGDRLEGREAFNISIRLPALQGAPFRLERKRQAWYATGTTKRPPTRRIVSITEIEPGESTCIKVEAEDGLFVTEDFIVTHNTTLLGTIPNLIVLDTEPNANNLASIAHLDVPYVTITNTDDLKQVLFMLKDPTLRKQIAGQYGMPDVGGVAIDTLDSLQKIMKAERMKEQRATQFLRDDWGWLKTEMEAIVESFTALPMHVIFTVHTKTKEMGKGDESYAVTLPGLEGSIAESIAGMVGYSLLSFRKEEVAADGTPYTKYWLRTEGDGTHDFLGTRTGGRLPTIIEPNMKTIYDAVMAGRPKKADPVPQPATPTAAQPTEQQQQPEQQAQEASGQAPEVAPSEGQSEPAAPSSEPAQAQPNAATATTSSDGRPSDDEPVNPAALGHVKRLYDSLEVAFPEDLIKALTIGEARNLIKMWRAIQHDHADGKGPVGMSPESEMLEYLTGQNLVSTEQPSPGPTAPVEPMLGGTIEQATAYAQGDLAKVQETYEYELANKQRKSLLTWCESNGAKPPTAPEPEPAQPQEATESAPEAVTPAEPSADAHPSEEEALKAVQEGLGAIVIEAPCDVCKKPIDDVDLAELGQKRFNKILCVEDYLAELRK